MTIPLLIPNDYDGSMVVCILSMFTITMMMNLCLLFVFVL